MSIDGIRKLRREGYELASAQPQAAYDVPLTTSADYTRPQGFIPPEQVAAHDDQTPEPTEPPVQKPKRSFKQWLAARSKKQWIIFSVIIVLVIANGVGTYFMLHKKAPIAQKPIVKAKKVVPTPPPTTEASKLTGRQVGFDVNKRPVIAVMIENSFDARPQSGLDQAGVVFEAVAEGGITRFVAFFQDTDPGYIGPVRSVRPYYLQWVLGFDAAIAHAGGSAEALASIPAWGVKDLNHDSTHFYRIGSRAAPHNLYTDITKLRDYASQKGFGASQFTGFERKSDKPSKAPNARIMSFGVSGDGFNPTFTYDPADNSYARAQDGKPHMVVDGSGNQTQIKPKVVVALVMQKGNNGIYTTYGSLGSGHAFVFQDGTVTEGNWSKPDKNASLALTDATGKTIKLNAGQTWFSVVGGNDRVGYQP
ncbi:MAG TPA: DUF3048 domain-containing protein [Candidatus Saccharimonadales bacterium]|nr:DUF3048 domain-containing protein [Candidatus Saccharimonadales bacterium]